MKQPAEPTHTPQASQTVSLPLSHLPLPPLFILLRACCPSRAFLVSRLPYASCVKPAIPTSASAPRPSAQTVGLLQLGPRLIQFPCCIPNGQAWVFTLDLWTTFWAKQEGDRRWSFMSIWIFSSFLSFLITLWGTPFLMCSHSLASLAALSCIFKLQLILCSQGLLQELSKVGPEPGYFFCCFPRLSAGRLLPQSLGPPLPLMTPRVSAWVSFFTSPNQTLPSQDSVVNLLQFLILFLIDGSLV